MESAKPSPEKSRHAHVRWTDDQISTLHELYAKIDNEVLAQTLKHGIHSVIVKANSLGLKKDKAFIARLRARQWESKDSTGRKSWFKEGHVVAPKGLHRPGYGPGRMKETQFKPGERSGAAKTRWLPVGSIRPDSGGYLRIKLREALPSEHYGFANHQVWPVLHRHLWEQHNGPVPAGYAVTFMDGKKENADDISNLELITKTDLLKRYRWRRGEHRRRD